MSSYVPLGDYVALARKESDRLAYRVPRHVDRDDLFGAALVGLADALRRRDPSVTNFQAYAVTRMRGQMFDFLRGCDSATRNEREALNDIDLAKGAYVAEHGRAPSTLELADRLDMRAEKIEGVLAGSLERRHVALSDIMAERLPAGLEPPDMQLARCERDENLRSEVRTLPDRLRHVLRLYYDEDLTHREVGLELGVTESRACQLHQEAIGLLRERLTQGKAA